MARIVLYPYKFGSVSCKALIHSLSQKKPDEKVFRVYPDRNYRPRPSDTIINWGNSHAPIWNNLQTNILNPTWAVSVASNKLRTLENLMNAGVSHVPFTTERSVAVEWPMIVERHTLTGHSGEGIIINPNTAFSNAPLYTKLLTPSVEYRVHIFRGSVIDYTKKVKRDDENVARGRVSDDYIRSHTNGWEYIRDVAPRDSVEQLAIDAVEALGLDFGAVDIIRHKRVNYVLEVGTAPGLSPMGIEAYANAILGL